MKYICIKDCYVRNPQGRLQHFKTGDTANYSRGEDVSEHFSPANGSNDSGQSGADEKEQLRNRLSELGVSCPHNAGIETMRKKIREAESE